MYIIIAYHVNVLRVARYIGPFNSREEAEDFISKEFSHDYSLTFEVAPLFPL